MKETISVLISKEEIHRAIQALARQIETEYEGKELHFICVLKGGVTFMVELAKAIRKNVYFHFMDVSSYGYGTESSGNLKILMDLDEPIAINVPT